MPGCGRVGSLSPCKSLALDTKTTPSPKRGTHSHALPTEHTHRFPRSPKSHERGQRKPGRQLQCQRGPGGGECARNSFLGVTSSFSLGCDTGSLLPCCLAAGRRTVGHGHAPASGRRAHSAACRHSESSVKARRSSAGAATDAAVGVQPLSTHRARVHHPPLGTPALRCLGNKGAMSSDGKRAGYANEFQAKREGGRNGIQKSSSG